MTPPLVMKKILMISMTFSKYLYIHITIPQDEPQIETVTPPLITSMVTQNKLKQNPNLALQAIYSLEPEPKTVNFKAPCLDCCHAIGTKASHDNKTGTLVLRPKDANIIGSKWVCRIKYTKKERLTDLKNAAKGFTQLPGIDFDEIFNPIIKPTTTRMVIALAMSSNWLMKQLDVQNAFLHGNLKEIIFIKQFHRPSPRHMFAS